MDNENQNQITLKELADLLPGAKHWQKGNKERIYLRRGHNTKKMKTNVFVYEENGIFKVSVFIDCPNQNMTWINKEKEAVKETVQNEVDMAVQAQVYALKTEDDRFLDTSGEPNDWEWAEVFLNEDEANIFLEEEAKVAAKVKLVENKY